VWGVWGVRMRMEASGWVIVWIKVSSLCLRTILLIRVRV
jgi:hypothetical protein